MKPGPRELFVVLAATVAVGLFTRYRGELKGLAGDSRRSEPVVEANGDLIVWSSGRPAGKTWANLGEGGKIEFQPDTGVDGTGKSLTIRICGTGHRSCGLNWKGWYPADCCDDVSNYQSLVFHIRQTTAVRDADLSVALVDNVQREKGVNSSNSISIVGDGALTCIDGQWRRVVIPLRRFTQHRPLRLDRLWEIHFSHQSKGEVAFQIDRIGFSNDRGAAAPVFPKQPEFSAEIRVDLKGSTHPIREGIYGVCSLPDELLRQYGIPITRFGGNTSTRYNWKINADNGAADWFFRNRGMPLRDAGGNAYVRHLRIAHAAGGATYITLPMMGWVAKDNSSYSYSVKKFGPQKEVDPTNPDAGNGIRKDGTLIRDAEPNDTSIAIEPEFVEQAVQFVLRQLGQAGQNEIRYWVLDNEPMLWHQTHRDVRREPLGYDELWERTVQYAEAIKRADPNARVAGFCSWGWTDLFYSAKDENGVNYSRPDHRAHGSMPLAEWFIKKCGEYRKKHRKALVDVFDFHWYPQAQVNGKTPYSGIGMDRKLNELRLRSPRDLWDPDYIPESWIRDVSGGQPAKVIRRVRDWIDRHNPGMEICLGEYNFGGADNITGGLAQADMFGILARERVDLAFIWSTPEGTQSLAWSLFRNYDNRGGRFGDEFVPASSGHRDIAVYAAKRKDGAITMVVINKSLGGECKLNLSLPGISGNLRAWRFDQTQECVYQVADERKKIGERMSTTLPAASASIFVINR